VTKNHFTPVADLRQKAFSATHQRVFLHLQAESPGAQAEEQGHVVSAIVIFLPCEAAMLAQS